MRKAGRNLLRRFHSANRAGICGIRPFAGGGPCHQHSKCHCRVLLGLVQLPHEPQRHVPRFQQLLAQRGAVRVPVPVELPLRNLVHRMGGKHLRLPRDARQIHHHGHARHMGLLPLQVGNFQISKYFHAGMAWIVPAEVWNSASSSIVTITDSAISKRFMAASKASVSRFLVFSSSKLTLT